MLRVLICASGELGFETLMRIEKDISIVAILSDKASLEIHKFANSRGIFLLTGNPRKEDFATKLEHLRTFDLILSINYLFLLPQNILQLASKMALNIHGSLLPKYRGRAPHIWAIIHGEEKIGVTIHRIDEGCDTGDIILQREMEVSASDTGGNILQKYKDLYPLMLKQIILAVESNDYTFIKQNESLATYYGKRTPEDGELDWSWKVKDIKNWVRALTSPYPGAFSFINNSKVKIWQVEESRYNGRTTAQPGEIVSVEKSGVYVKASDGIIKIINFECNTGPLSVGMKFQEKKYEQIN